MTKNQPGTLKLELKIDIMEKSNEEKGLLEEFAIPAYEEWLTLVEDQLKGAPFEKKLVSHTAEGIPIQPIYLRKDVQKLVSQLSPPGQYPFVRGTKASGNTHESWAVSQANRFPTAEVFNQIAIRDIANGLTSLQIILDEAGKAGQDPDQSTAGVVGRNGLSVINREDMIQAFKGIDLSALHVQLEGGINGYGLLMLMLEYLQSNKIPFASLHGGMIFDPLAELATSGALPASLSTIFDRMAQLVQMTQTVVPGFKTIGIDARSYCEGGGSSAQELGFAMASAVTYLREIQQRGLTVDEIAPAINFTFAIGSDFFLEIAKVRAVRILWARIVSLLGGNELSQKATLHSVSAQYNKTIHDPYVNMLRTTTEAFSSVIGGSDILTVTPFDDLFGLPDDMSRRVARNLQIILKEECHGNHVIDPSGGSWFVENLTEQLGEAAWSVFQDVEKVGGMAEALKTGFIQNAISEVDQKRRQNFGQRKDVVVGTNMYANVSETLPEMRQPEYDPLWQSRAKTAKDVKSSQSATPILANLNKLVGDSEAKITDVVDTGIEAVTKGATLGELYTYILGEAAGSENITPITIQRKTAAYEALRKKSAEIASRTGSAPTVFLANMGPLRQHKARADFSTGFLEPGGFSVISPDGFDNIEDAVSAARDSNAPIVVICSTDDTYPELVPAFTEQIKKSQPDVAVLVAGYPKEHVTRFQEIGVDDFIHLKADNLQILTKLQAAADK